MKILHVIHDFIPECNAGSEIFTHDLCLSLNQMGAECRVLCRGFSPDCSTYDVTESEINGIPVTRIQHGSKLERKDYVRKDRRVEEIFSDFVSKWVPDIIHFQNVRYLSDDLSLMAQEIGISTIFTLHDLWAVCPNGTLLRNSSEICNNLPGPVCYPCIWPSEASKLLRKPLKSLLPVVYLLMKAGLPMPDCLSLRDAQNGPLTWLRDSQAVIDNADVVTAPSLFLKEKMISSGMKHEDMRVVPHGVRLERFAGFHRNKGERIRFGFIGTASVKGLHIALQAFGQLNSLNAELHIYGRTNPQLLDQYENFVSDGRIVNHGPFAADDVSLVFGSFDILLMPSIWYENSPTVIREAFATGTPVIASDIGGMKEAIRHGVDGLLFRVADPGDLAEKMALVITDPDMYGKMSAGVPEVTSQEKSARMFFDLYREVLDKKRVTKVRNGNN